MIVQYTEQPMHMYMYNMSTGHTNAYYTLYHGCNILTNQIAAWEVSYSMGGAIELV